MSGMSPSSVLFSSDGYELAVVSGTAFIPGTRSILFAGNDGTDTRTLLVDSLGRPVMVGAGVAGTPAGGVITIQGDPAGTAVPISGTVAATQSGSWTVAATQSGSWTVTANAGTGTFNIAGTVTSNQGTPNTLANAWPITITDGYGQIQGSAIHPIYVTGSITATNPSVGTDGAAALGFDTQVGGKVTTAAPTYTNGNLDALSLTTLGGLRIDGVYASGTANATAADLMANGAYVTTAAPTYTTGQLSALSLDTAGNLRVLAAQGTTPWSVVTNKATASTVTSVAQSTSNTQLLAANANRVFASIYNNTGQKMFIKLGTTASTTSYSIQLMPNSYWEVPSDWTGEIDAVWSGNGSSSALVTELTP